MRVRYILAFMLFCHFARIAKSTLILDISNGRVVIWDEETKQAIEIMTNNF